MQNKTACEFMEEHVVTILPTAASAAPQDKYKSVGQKRKSRDTGREDEKEEKEEEEEGDKKGKEVEADPSKSKTQRPSEEEQERKQFAKLLSRGMQRQLVESQGKEFVAIDLASLLRHSVTASRVGVTPSIPEQSARRMD
jgi:hypothetical protein